MKRCFARQLYRHAAAESAIAREDTFARELEAQGELSDQMRRLIVAFEAKLLAAPPSAAE